MCVRNSSSSSSDLGVRGGCCRPGGRATWDEVPWVSRSPLDGEVKGGARWGMVAMKLLKGPHVTPWRAWKSS